MTPEDFGLNPGQCAAVRELEVFLQGPGKEHCLSGPGGTGKTYTVSYLINHLIPDFQQTQAGKRYFDVYLSATTNKAAAELARATGRDCGTIHSLLGLRVQNNYETGEVELKRGRNWAPTTNAIIFIDEASMADTPLRKEILASTINCKVIYVGDHSQLKPVKESTSPVYDAGLPFSVLRQPMRTDVPELQALNQQLRDTVAEVKSHENIQSDTERLNLQYAAFKPIRLVPGVIDLVTGQDLKALIDTHFQDLNHNNRIVAYTNKRVIQYNSYIRDELRQLPATPTEGEILVNNNALQLKEGMVAVEAEVEILKVKGIKRFILQSATAHTAEVAIDCTVVDMATRGGLFEDVHVPINKDYVRDLIKYYASVKNWELHFMLKEKFPDLRDREASTTHKAQGASHDVVFIDGADLSTCTVPDTMARLLYVACSRARKRVIFTSPLAPKYGGLIT